MSSAEDKIHRYLLLGLSALALGVMARAPEPSTPAPHGVVAKADRLERGELEPAIARLKAWVVEARAKARTPAEHALCLAGLGIEGPKEAAGPVRLAAALTDHALAPSAAQRVASERAALGEARETEPEAVLAILLETGLTPEHRVELTSGPARLDQLVQNVLEGGADRAPSSSVDAWRLDLLSLATLSGQDEWRPELAKRTEAALRFLDRWQREATHPDPRAPRAALLEALPEALHVSAVTFRAAGVLAEPELDLRARRYSNALVTWYRGARAELADATRDGSLGPTWAVLEQLGRFEQALYAAYISTRRADQSGPSGDLGRAMRAAARDMLDRLTTLEPPRWVHATGALEPRDVQALRAVVHVLRGLRTARVAAQAARPA